MAGRKSKLTPELIVRVEQLLSAGNYVTTVCDFVGIDKSTWYRWLEQGSKEEAGLFREFCDTVKKAEAGAEVRAVTGILKAGQTSWQALAWFLERKHPEKWSSRQKQP